MWCSRTVCVRSSAFSSPLNAEYIQLFYSILSYGIFMLSSGLSFPPSDTKHTGHCVSVSLILHAFFCPHTDSCLSQEFSQGLWHLGRNSAWSPHWYASSQVCSWCLLLHGSPNPDPGLRGPGAASLETTHASVQVQTTAHITKYAFRIGPVTEVMGWREDTWSYNIQHRSVAVY